MMKVRISVVIPTFNLANVVGATLDSVVSQTVLPDEVIVVDDGSTDGTIAEVEQCAARLPGGTVRIVRGSHRGPGASRNVGIASSTGDWIAFLDGDDLWDSTKIEKLGKAITGNPSASIVAHDEYERDLQGREIYKPLHQRFDPSRPLLPQLYRANFLSTSCVAVSRELAASTGGMDESLPAAQDYDFWLKLARHGRLVFIPEPLETYVLRANSVSSRVLVRYDCMVRIAFRHAPWVAAETGATRAWALRLRYLLAMVKGLLQQSLSNGNPGEVARLLLRALRDMLLTVVRPIGRLE